MCHRLCAPDLAFVLALSFFTLVSFGTSVFLGCLVPRAKVTDLRIILIRLVLLLGGRRVEGFASSETFLGGSAIPTLSVWMSLQVPPRLLGGWSSDGRRRLACAFLSSCFRPLQFTGRKLFSIREPAGRRLTEERPMKSSGVQCSRRASRGDAAPLFRVFVSHS